MGFAVSWLAVREAEVDELLQSLKLFSKDERATYGDSLFTGRVLPSGWFILFINKLDHPFVTPESLKFISNGNELLSCSIEEHIMWNKAELWRDGAQVWSVEHDAQKGLRHITTSGRLPADYDAIKAELGEKQNKAGGQTSNIDFYFDIPLQLAKSVVGFKHDESFLGDEDFRVFESSDSRLAPAPPAANEKPWWRF